MNPAPNVLEDIHRIVAIVCNHYLDSHISQCDHLFEDYNQELIRFIIADDPTEHRCLKCFFNDGNPMETRATNECIVCDLPDVYRGKIVNQYALDGAHIRVIIPVCLMCAMLSTTPEE